MCERRLKPFPVRLTPTRVPSKTDTSMFVPVLFWGRPEGPPDIVSSMMLHCGSAVLSQLEPLEP